MSQTYNLTKDPIPSLIWRIATPAIVGWFFMTMYNVVDTWFAGLISTTALASLSIAFPVFFLVVAIASGTETGATALIANALGADDLKKARIYTAQSLTFGLLLGLVVTVVGLLAAPKLLALLGAQGDYLAIALSYMNVIFAGTLLFVTNRTLNAPLVAWGDARSFRNVIMLGCALNVALDPWFIYGGFGLPALGFKGIALSTVLIQGFSCIYLAHRLFKTPLGCRELFRLMRPRLTCLREVAHHVFPATLNLATVGIGIFIITWFISRFGQEPVAAFGVATRVEHLVLLPLIGLNMSTLAIVGQNYGAGAYDRMKEGLYTTIKYGFVIMSLGSVFIFVTAPWMMALFTQDENLIRIGAQYLRIDALIFCAYVVLFIAVAGLQGMRHPMYAIWIGLYRQVLAPLLIIHLLAHVLGWGLWGIWWGIFIVTWSAAIFTMWYTHRMVSRLV